MDSAHFWPALMYYTEGRIDEATQLLEELLKHKKTSEKYRPVGLFWLGRMYEDKGEKEKSRAYFEKVIGQNSDYYAIRAMMHINEGSEAATKIFPDKSTEEDIRRNYRMNTESHRRSNRTPYLQRLFWALDTGLYTKALVIKKSLYRQLTTDRFDREAPFYLDGSGILTPLALWLALRQDAMAAEDHHDLNTLVETAKRIGEETRDWTTSLQILHQRGDVANLRIIPGYLSIAYPDVFNEILRKYGIEYNILPELLYAVIRHESLFYPAAISKSGALGLFQFMPATFKTLNERWKLVSQQQISESVEAYLYDPELNIELGARWFNGLLRRQDGSVLFAVMEHNAGYPAVRQWKTQWKKADRLADVEYMIDTTRYLQTRLLARSVLGSMAIAKASRIFLRGAQME